MAQNPLIKRYLDAGMAFTQMTQAKAEAIVRDLVKTGEVQANRTEDLVNELIDRSRRNTEALLELVRAEVRSQLASLGLLREDEGAEGAAAQVEEHRSPQRPPAPAAEQATEAMAAQAAAGDLPATTVAPAKAVPAKKTPAAKKAGAKKAAAKKAAAKKAGAKKSGAKKAAKKATKGSGA